MEKFDEDITPLEENHLNSQTGVNKEISRKFLFIGISISIISIIFFLLVYSSYVGTSFFKGGSFNNSANALEKNDSYETEFPLNEILNESINSSNVTSENETKVSPSSGGGGSGGSGPSETSPCSNECSSIGRYCIDNYVYSCTLEGDGCLDRSFIEECGFGESCSYGECGLLFESIDLTDNVLVIYNSNSPDSIEIAEYYTDSRGIDEDHLCGIKTPPGTYMPAKYLLGARKTIIEDCICPMIQDKMMGSCDISNINEIVEYSPITHLAIMRGIPLRLYDTGWTLFNSDGAYPPTDYYLSVMLYMDSENMFARSEQGRFLTELNYSNLLYPEQDFQAYDSRDAYLRDINISYDRQVAYGRIEAINKERTFDLIDRTLAAEAKGLSGKAYYASWGVTGDDNTKFFDKTLNLGDDCLDYISNYNSANIYSNCGVWPIECRFGMTAGEIPGRSGSILPKVFNASMYIGNYPGIGTGIFLHWHNAFYGFNNMLNWRVTEEECEPLCENTIDPEACRVKSKDYFKELNSDCVGVAGGFLGWQFRSFPVQYYHFMPPGWETQNGESLPSYANTQSFIKEGGAYNDESFTDNLYIHYGAEDVNSPINCIIADGSEEECREFIGAHMRTDFSISPEEITGTKNFTFRFRHRNPESLGSRIYISHRISFYDGSSYTYSSGGGSVDISEEALDWTVDEINYSIISPIEKTAVGMKVFIYQDYFPPTTNSWQSLDLDGMEIFDRNTGKQYLSKELGSFNESKHYDTAWGDWAVTVIDRLGGIAWWGSSSHWRTGGYAYQSPNKFIGAFYSGRTLGESILYNSRNSESGLFFGDPLYRPSGFKLILNEGSNRFNSDKYYYRYNFNFSNADDVKIYANAFHGWDNLDTVNWEVAACYSDSIDYCDSNDGWTVFETHEGYSFEGEINTSVLEFVPDLNEDYNITLRLRVWNDLSEEYFSYGYLSYEADEIIGASAITGNFVRDVYSEMPLSRFLGFFKRIFSI